MELNKNIVDWERICDGPTQAYHCSCLIGSKLFTHGGITNKRTADPLNKLFVCDLSSFTWNDITTGNSPFLSHHSCNVINDRYILFIGGWNGKKRCSDVHAYDIENNRWLFPRTIGFPTGAGLSSHTSTLLHNGDIVILGREGGLRIQRRSGNSFILSGNVQTGFSYRENPIGLSSRSGHSTFINNNMLVVTGGRDDKPIEKHSGFRKGYKSCYYMETFSKYINSTSIEKSIPIRRHHTIIDGCDMMLMYGGEPFTGRSIIEPSGDIFLFTLKPNITCYKLATSLIARSGHVSVYDNNNIYMHGGEAAKSLISNVLYQLIRK